MGNPMNRPPIGSTDWAAGQFLRLLKEQAAAKVAGERGSEVGGEEPGPLDWLVDPAAATQPAVPHPAALARMRLAQGAPSASWGINRVNGDHTDITPEEAIHFVLSQLPGSGEAMSAMDYNAHAHATWDQARAGNYGTAANEFLKAGTAAVGMLPIVGTIGRGLRVGARELEAAIRRFGEGGLFGTTDMADFYTDLIANPIRQVPAPTVKFRLGRVSDELMTRIRTAVPPQSAVDFGRMSRELHAAGATAESLYRTPRPHAERLWRELPRLALSPEHVIPNPHPDRAHRPLLVSRNIIEPGTNINTAQPKVDVVILEADIHNETIGIPTVMTGREKQILGRRK